jgi:hypothetical protein
VREGERGGEREGGERERLLLLCITNLTSADRQLSLPVSLEYNFHHALLQNVIVEYLSSERSWKVHVMILEKILVNNTKIY